MCPVTNFSTAPGLALNTLLRDAKPAQLRDLITPDVFATIRGIDPNLVSNERLGDLALQLLEPEEVLRDAELRQKIVRMLPLPKARELGGKLSVAMNREIYNELGKAVAKADNLPELFSFFGVVIDERAPQVILPSFFHAKAGYALFEHQRRTAKRVHRTLLEEPRKVVLHMPTGAGKTRTAMHIICEFLKRNEPTVVCWLARNAELLEQASEEFHKAWGFLGDREVDLIRYWGKRNQDPLAINDGLIVAGLDKMVSLDRSSPTVIPKLADRTTLTVIDEAHQAIAPTYSAIITALKTKRPRNGLLGLTATPGRSWSDIDEDLKLSEYFDGMKVTLEVEGYEDPVSYLVNEQYLARTKFKYLKSDASMELSTNDSYKFSSSIDVPEGVLNKLGRDVQRNLSVLSAIEDLLTRHSRVIVFAASVQNARILNAICRLRGHDSSVVTSSTDGIERERVISQFKIQTNQAKVIINFGVLTTGFDAPSTSAAIIARPTRSLVLYSQMVGRATRGIRAGGNAEAEIITVVDPQLPGFGSVTEAFKNWEDVWHEPTRSSTR